MRATTKRRIVSQGIARECKSTASVIANFKRVVKEGDLRLHPLVTHLVGKDVLEKMGAMKVGGEA